MRRSVLSLLLAATLASGAASAWAQGDVRFDIVRFEVQGNSLLPATRVQELVKPYIGRHKVYGDIQKALESLEGAYRALGYGTVQVYVPEQELTTGVVRIQVTEGAIGKVRIVGNKHFDEDNIRASLPNLREGEPPNMRKLSENIQLANENPAKKVELTLGVAEEEGKVDARLEVTDEDPSRVYVTFDNTGTRQSGRHRLGVSYQNANVANRDQVLTLAYITTPDAPRGVKVDIFSAGYRLPLYGIGDSIDVIYANSSTNTPANVLAPGGTLGVMGKGEVFAFRYNHIFPRQGEYSSKLVLGLDYKHINATCTNNGTPVVPGTVSSCTPYTVRPVSATYSGQWQRPGEAIDFNLGVLYHAFPMGADYGFPNNLSASRNRYSFVVGRPTAERFVALRYGGSYLTALPQEMMFRAALSGQHARGPLPSGEQIGLSGAASVRGFSERAVSADQGYFANLELYSPEYAGRLGLPGSFKAVAFYDWGVGRSYLMPVNTASRMHIASLGIGFRYSLNKDIAAKFDLVRVMDGHQATLGGAEAGKPGDFLGHFSIAYGF